MADHGAGDGDVAGNSLTQMIIPLIALGAAQARWPAFQPAQLVRRDAAEGFMGKQPRVDQRRPEIGRRR